MYHQAHHHEIGSPPGLTPMICEDYNVCEKSRRVFDRGYLIAWYWLSLISDCLTLVISDI